MTESEIQDKFRDLATVAVTDRRPSTRSSARSMRSIGAPAWARCSMRSRMVSGPDARDRGRASGPWPPPGAR